MTQKKNRQRGSVILLVLLTLSGIVLLCTKRWFSTSLLLDSVLKKEAYTKQFWLVQGLLECGTMVCKNNWEKMHTQLSKKKKKTITLVVEQWPPHNRQYQGRVLISKASEQALQIHAYLYEEKNKRAGLSCLISTDTDRKKFKISPWCIS